MRVDGIRDRLNNNINNDIYANVSTDMEQLLPLDVYFYTFLVYCDRQVVKMDRHLSILPLLDNRTLWKPDPLESLALVQL